MKKFENKVVLITGAASGFGRALAESLAKQGAYLVITDIDQANCQIVVDEIIGKGGKAIAYALNVTKAERFDEIINKVVVSQGKLDLLINNAGIAVSGEFIDIDTNLWKKVTDINFLGMVFGSQSAYRQMKKQGFGHIVNVASMYGLVSSPMVSAYVATKHAVVGFTQALREEARIDNVNVSVVCPGYIATDLFKNGTFKGVSEEKSMEMLPFKLMDVEKAAEKCLSGIKRNKAIMTFPGYVKPYWWLTRISPSLLVPINRFFLKRFRKNKS